MTRARVVGAGLSGLAAAWHLTEAGARVDIFEAGRRPGGLIQTATTAHGLVETAANAFVWTPGVRELFAAAGVAPLFARRESRRRYVWRDGRPRQWPLSPIETAGMAARLGWAWSTRATPARAGETAAAWADRVLGRAARARLLEPALFGVYGAPASALSAEALALGGRRSRPVLAAPERGMGALIDALHQSLAARGVTFHFSTPLTALDSRVPTLVCTSARDAAPLLEGAGLAALAGALRRVRMLPLVTATAFFAPAADDLRGFGVLFPEGTAAARGALFNAEIFEGRGPLRSETWIFAGGDWLDAPDAQVAAAITRDRALLTERTDAPVGLTITRVPQALPLYDRAILTVREASETLPPWLGLCGNYTGKIGVAALVDAARREARRVLAEGANARVSGTRPRP